MAFANSIVLALDSTLSVSQYNHRAWQIDDGLPQNSVQAIAQTPDGYIWLATQEGLARFDGIKFRVFDNRNTPALKANNIQTLYVNRAGALWIGTEGGGLTRMAGSQFTTYTVEDGLADSIVECIHEDDAGALWVGTLGGLSRFKDGRFTTFTTADGLAANSVLALASDTEGALWIGTEGGGLSRFKDGSLKILNKRDGLADELIRTICVDRKGAVWVGTPRGLCRLQGGRFTNFTVKDGLSDDNVTCIYEDADGNLWVGTEAGGLNRLANSAFTAFTTKEGLTRNSVASVYQDVEGSLWVGAYGGGLSRLKSGKFITFTVHEGLPHDTAQATFEDSKGAMWIGTADGLARLKDGSFTAYTRKDGLSNETILSIYEDRENNLWVGTANGLNRLRDGKFTVYKEEDGLSEPTVLALCEDSSGALWIGTAGGLSRFKDGKFVTYTSDDGLSNNSVSALREGRDGSIWIGTGGGGLNRFKDGRFSSYTTKDGLVDSIVMALYEDADGSMWVGTSHGLSRLKDGRFTNYTTRDGLYDDVMFQILEDGGGNLWMSCNKGIFRVSKRELEEFADGAVASLTCVSYGTADGMKARECNGGFQPAGWKSKDGRLWFPTIRGVAVIDPENIKVNRQPPPVLIEELFADGKPIELGKPLSLSPGTEKLEIGYAGLSYLAPEKVKFRYMLEGYDTGWTEAGTRREAVYTNLAPGSYSFKVMACNNDGLWNESGAALAIYLEPRFYQTYWFYALSVAALALFAWMLYQLRVRQMNAQFAAVLAERNRIARDIHDSLAQSFVGVALQLQVVKAKLQESPRLAAEHLDLAVSLVTHSLDEARRSIRELRSGSLEKRDLAQGLLEVAKQLTAGSPTQVELKVRGSVPQMPADAESNLFRIGQEAITNAVKHAQARKIQIRLGYHDGHIMLCVKDDGRGFNMRDFSSVGNGHFGLIGMKERAKSMSGRIEFNSSPGQGTEVVLVAPLAGDNHAKP